MGGDEHGTGRRIRRRALAVAMVCAVLAVPTLGAAPAAHGQDAVEYALLVAQLALLARDTQPPVITITTPSEGAVYTPGQAVNADYTCADAGVAALTVLAGGNLDNLLAIFAAHGVDLGHPTCDGPVSSGAALDTASPGPHTFTVTARDVAFTFADTDGDGLADTLRPQPNTASVTVHYGVSWPFSGFKAPVANPTAVNAAKAGQAVPIKFGLGGDRGLGVLASVTSSPADCSTSAPAIPSAPAAAPGNSGLQYDAASDTYSWVWKTEPGWKGTCRALTVALADGTTHEARFAFK